MSLTAESAHNVAHVLSEALPYIRRFGGKTVVCFFQGAAKFEARYATIGFNDAATLDEGSMWPVSFAITEPDEANEQRISDLVWRAAS